MKITGTLGVIVKGKETGVISSVKEILEKLERFDFWMSESLKEKILSQAGEK